MRPLVRIKFMCSNATFYNKKVAYKFTLSENILNYLQTLKAHGLETFYWTPGTSSQNEVEFVTQNRRGEVVPIEVKSGDNVSSASLSKYQKRSNAPVAIRISTRNLGFENSILSVPLYAAFCIDEQSITWPAC